MTVVDLLSRRTGKVFTADLAASGGGGRGRQVEVTGASTVLAPGVPQCTRDQHVFLQKTDLVEILVVRCSRFLIRA